MSEAPFTNKPRRSIFRSSKNDARILEDLAVVTQIGFTMAGCIGFCFWVGYHVDGWLGAHGIVLTVSIILGIVGGGWTVYRQIQDVYRGEGNYKRGEDRDA